MPYGKGYKEQANAPKTKDKYSQAMEQQQGGHGVMSRGPRTPADPEPKSTGAVSVPNNGAPGKVKPGSARGNTGTKHWESKPVQP